MERPAVYAAAGGTAHHHGHWRSPAKMRLGQHVRDLVEGATDEVHELELGYRTQAGKRRPKLALIIAISEMGVSTTRCGPKRSINPSVTLKAPP